MALTRARKAQKVEQLAAELQGSTSAIVGTFTKLTVSQDFALRQKVREAGGRYRVLKNKLASRASEGTGIAGALQGLKGVSSVAYTSGDPVALAKALSDWVKDNAQFTFKLGIVDGKVINVEEVQALATMPGKEEIFAKLLFLINAPAQRLATVMAATGRDLAIVVNQAVEKEKFSAGGSATAAPAATPAAEAATESAPAPAPEPAAAPEPVAESAPAPETGAAPEPAAVAELTTEAAQPEAPAAEAPATEAPQPEASAPSGEAAPETPADAEATGENQTESASNEAPVEGQ